MRTLRAVVAIVALCVVAVAGHGPDSRVSPQLSRRVAQPPSSFEINEGQADPAVKFLSRGPGYTLFLTETDAVLGLRNQDRQAVVKLRTVGGKAQAVIGEELSSATSNYYVGHDRSKWRRGIAHYNKVQLRDVYPGINLVYYGNGQQLEYDFIVSPGADPRAIAVAFDGADRLALDDNGDLLLSAGTGQIRMKKPVAYQEVGRRRVGVPARYVIAPSGQVKFDVGRYDRRTRLVIDPVVVYSTYLGGSGIDQALAIAVDGAGNAYVTGLTTSVDFPVTPGAHDTSGGGFFTTAFVTKLDPTGSALIYSTYLGGTTGDEGRGIAVDASGNAYVTGVTTSNNFPATLGAFDTTFNGNFDAFAFKLDGAGALVYSTYLGGTSFDSGNGLAVDATGHAVVAGHTTSANFPTTPTALSTTLQGSGDAFVIRLTPDGSAATFSTYVGGSGFDMATDVAVDGSGAAYITGHTFSEDFPTTLDAFDTSFNGPRNGQDVFVSKLDASGGILVHSTYLGGADYEFGSDIAVDSSGNAYITGSTFSPDFPVTGGAFDTTLGGMLDGFVAKLDATGGGLSYASYLGGSDDSDTAVAIAVDAAGQATVVGQTTSTDFPTTADAIQPVSGGGSDVFVTTLNATGSAALHSTYLGGTQLEQVWDVAIGPGAAVFVTGDTDSADFPTSAAAFDRTSSGRDAFVVMIASPPVSNTPTDKDQCKNDGWRQFTDPAFRNQGQCVSYVERRRK